MPIFSDNFNDNNLTGWEVETVGSGTITSETNDRLQISRPENAITTVYVRTEDTFSLRNDSIFVEVPQVAPTFGNPNTVYTAFRYGLVTIGDSDGNIGIAFYNSSGVDKLGWIRSVPGGAQDNATTNINYDPVAHRWWRIREYNNVLYGEVSTDSNVWVHPDGLSSAATAWQRAVGDLGGWTPDDNPAVFEVFSSINTAAAGTSIFDNYNITRVPSLASFTAEATMGANATKVGGTSFKTSGAVALSVTTNLTVSTRKITKSGIVAMSGSATMIASATEEGAGTVKLSGSVALTVNSNLVANAIRKLAFTVMPAVSLSATATMTIFISSTIAETIPAAYKAFIDGSYHLEQLLLTAVNSGYVASKRDDANRSFLLPIPILRNPTTGDQIISYKFGKGNSGAGTTNITVSLFEGADKTIATWEHENIPTISSLAYHTLTEDQIRSISNYSDLSLKYTIL